MYTGLFTLLLVCIVSQGTQAKRANFVFVLTDDQDLHLDGLVPMRKTLKLVANEGTLFQNAFVNTPICCPSRSSILTGKYAHNLHVYNNSISGNCSSIQWQTYQEPHSFASILNEKANYNVFYAGKYLNQYGSKESNGIEHIPKGYDWWIGLKGNSRYYNYTLSVNGTSKSFTNDYLTDVIRDYALDFLNQQDISRPFFMMLAPPAPHAPFTPAPRHENLFPDARAIRNPAFNYTPAEKHWLVKMQPDHLPENVTRLDNIQRHRQQTLVAVDEMVEDVMLKLKELNILNNTYVIFSSDNGFHIGQFTQPWDKRQPYQTDVNVPFMIFGPGIQKKRVSEYPITSVDIAPTILDLADVEIPTDMDGTSFKQELFSRNSTDVSKSVFIEYWGEGNTESIDVSCLFNENSDLAHCYSDSWCKCQDSRNNTFTCVMNMNPKMIFKFCRFSDDQQYYEAYNLLEDPFELNNIFNEMEVYVTNSYIDLLDKYEKCDGVECVRLTERSSPAAVQIQS